MRVLRKAAGEPRMRMWATSLKQSLAHVLWIGGAPDSGKTTIARILANRFRLQCYHYDREDARQLRRLAETMREHEAFLAATVDERWVRPEPEFLMRRTLASFRDRFPLVVEDLLALPHAPLIVAEGFGLAPEWVAPVLSSPNQAIWLVPTGAFKRASMDRRNKPSFRNEATDPDRAFENLLRRDRLLAEHIQAEARARGLTVWQVDGSASAEELAARAAEHFEPFLRGSTGSRGEP